MGWSFFSKSGALKAGSNMPTGTVLPTAASIEPAGWLLCYGQAVSRSTYAVLFNVIGSNFGSGDGSTTFNVPDLRGRVPAGKDNMGGSAASRLTSTVLSASNALGATGGAQTHTLAVTEIPSHRHEVGVSGADDNNHTGNGDFVADSDAAYKFNRNTTFAGGGQAHTNTQPTIVLNYIIYTGE